jgi:hypothetical protein
MEVVVIPEMTTIHIPIITIIFQSIPRVQLLMIFIHDVHQSTFLLHVHQRLTNATKIIHETFLSVMHLGFDCFNRV